MMMIMMMIIIIIIIVRNRTIQHMHTYCLVTTNILICYKLFNTI